MKIINLTQGSKTYTSNVYFVLGTWNTLEDVNTLVDVGRDPLVIEAINTASTGVGKKRVQQVILTHSHYDHVSLLPEIRQIYKPQVFAFSSSLKGVDSYLRDGQIMRLGDREFEIIHTPGHSNDSVCLYCEEEQVLFAGDTSLIVQSSNDSFERAYVQALEKICCRDIRIIYPGHGPPLDKRCNELLEMSLRNVKNAYIREN